MSRGSFCRSASLVMTISPVGGGEAGREAGGLAEVAAEADDPPARIALVDGSQPREAVVAAAVVDDDHLVVTARISPSAALNSA